MVHMRLHYFFVEFRFHRYPKDYLKSLIGEVASRFRVRGALKYRPVPHMSLYGPFQTKEFRDVFSRIEKVAKRYTLVPFAVYGFDRHDGKNGKVIAAGITASPELKSLRRELAEELNKIVKRDDRQPWDNEGDYWFHTTIAMKDIDRQFEDIWHYINKKEKPHINQHLVRITILNRRRRIEREYDLTFKRWLTRREALSRHLWRKTVDRLMELQGLPPEQKPLTKTWFHKLFWWLR
jgi:2'-5' RNA ligase